MSRKLVDKYLAEADIEASTPFEWAIVRLLVLLVDAVFGGES